MEESPAACVYFVFYAIVGGHMNQSRTSFRRFPETFQVLLRAHLRCLRVEAEAEAAREDAGAEA
jgi:hypothetical protein